MRTRTSLLLSGLLVVACDGSQAPADAAATDAGAGVDAGVGQRQDVPGGMADATTAGGTAQVKVCNLLANEISFEIGQPPLRLAAAAGTCAPAVPQACPTVRAGSSVPVAILDGMRLLGGGNVALVAGESYVFIAAVNMGQPAVQWGAIRPEFRCSELDPLMRPPDGGAGQADRAPASDARPPG